MTVWAVSCFFYFNIVTSSSKYLIKETTQPLKVCGLPNTKSKQNNIKLLNYFFSFSVFISVVFVVVVFSVVVFVVFAPIPPILHYIGSKKNSYKDCNIATKSGY